MLDGTSRPGTDVVSMTYFFHNGGSGRERSMKGSAGLKIVGVNSTLNFESGYVVVALTIRCANLLVCRIFRSRDRAINGIWRLILPEGNDLFRICPWYDVDLKEAAANMITIIARRIARD